VKSAIRTLGMLLVLTSGTSGLMAKEQPENPIKQPARAEATEKKAAMQLKRTPRKTPQMTQTQRPPLPTYVAPDPKMLGLGCASGED
jgi:hypothetical protein